MNFLKFRSEPACTQFKLRPLYLAMLPVIALGVASNLHAATLVDNIDDGSKTAVSMFDILRFDAPAAGLDEIFTINGIFPFGDGHIAADPLTATSVDSNTANGVGAIWVESGNGVAQGSIGSDSNRLGEIMIWPEATFWSGGNHLFVDKINILTSFGGSSFLFIENLNAAVTNGISSFGFGVSYIDLSSTEFIGSIKDSGLMSLVTIQENSSVSGTVQAGQILLKTSSSDGSMVTLSGAVETREILYGSRNVTLTLGSSSSFDILDFNNNAGTLILNDGVDLRGWVISTGGTNGTIEFQGDGSISGDITDVATINTGVGTVTLNNAVTGSTTLNHSGAGMTMLNGTNTYTGTTTVAGGTLYVNGSNSNSTTTVNTGGSLGGTGTVGSVYIAGGALAPGNSIGTINVAGNVDFSSGGIYKVEVDAAGNSDLIDATGTATLTSGVVQVLPEAGTYGLSTDYTILTALGGLGGTTFNSVTSSLAFLDPTLSYDTNNVYLNLTRNFTNFTSVARTQNQIAVASNLVALSASNPTAVEDILNNILLLTDNGAQQAFDSLGGVQHSMNPGLQNNLMQRFTQIIRMHRGGVSRDNPLTAFNSMSARSDMNSRDALDKDRHWWVRGFADDGNINRDGTIAGVGYRNKGLVFGVDMPFDDQWTLGLAGNYAQSDINGGGSNADVESYQLAAYTNWQQENWYADIAIAFARHDTNSDRTVTVGTLTETANANYDSGTVGVSAEAGKHMMLDNGINLAPFAGLEYNKTDRGSFTETGSFANLAVSSETHESIRSKLGLKVSKSFETNKGTQYAPSAYIAYVHEYGDKDNLLTAAFSAAPNSTFAIEGSETDRDRLQLGFGFTARINDTTQLNLGYDGEFAGSDDYNSLGATLRVVW